MTALASIGLASLLMAASLPFSRPDGPASTECEALSKLLDTELSTYLTETQKPAAESRFKPSLERIESLLHQIAKQNCPNSVTLRYVKDAFMATTRHRIAPEQSSQSRLFDFLAEKNLLQPVTPEVRVEMGGEWNEFDRSAEGYRPRIMAAYDCLTGIIWYDPLLAPYNLGGALAHEMDHLLRDKIFYSEDWNGISDVLPVEILNVVDETLANFFGAVTQFRVYFDSVVWNDSPSSLNSESSRDLSLFSRDGVVTALVQDPRRKALLKSIGPRGQSWTFSRLLSLYEKPGLEYWQKHVLGLVKEAYYPSSREDPEQLLSGLQAWLRYSQTFDTPYPFALFTDRSEAASAPALDTLAKNLGHTSPACSAFAKSVKEGVRPTREDSPATKDVARPMKGTLLPIKEGVRPTIDLNHPPTPSTDRKQKPGREARACRWPDRRM